jgi:hypothetical protein
VYLDEKAHRTDDLQPPCHDAVPVASPDTGDQTCFA